MKFLAVDLIANAPHLLTGHTPSQRDRFRRVVDNARYAEELGFDAIGIGERHAPPFLSSSPPVVLAHLAAVTSRVRLVTTVTVLSLLDPVRVAEDYATLDHLSGGRLELIVGKGNDPHQSALFGYDVSDQWERNRENYELLRRLWREEEVTWSGTYRPALRGATTQPRPLQRPTIPIWHGSATSEESTELAARWGDPLFSANGFHPLEKYAALVRHYRRRYEEHGHGPASSALVGAGAGASGLHLDRSSRRAVETFRPYYEAFTRTEGFRHNDSPFVTLEDNIAGGPALVGSPQQVLEKIHLQHEAFGHQVLALGIEGFGLPEEQRRASLELFFSEVAPVLRAELPSAVWP